MSVVLQLRIVFIGQGLVLAGCVARARQLGCAIIGVLDTGGKNAPCRNAVADYIRAHEHDVLLSVGNPFILDAELLELPRITAINYHNALLPDYAGLRATAWAIYNGELEHGVTWHLMTAAVDTGAVLVQRRFSLADDETAGSLDIRCTTAAIETLDEVLDLVQSGRLRGTEQHSCGWRYYGRNDTVPFGGVLDWSSTREQIVRTVRACDAGSGSRDFGYSLAA